MLRSMHQGTLIVCRISAGVSTLRPHYPLRSLSARTLSAWDAVSAVVPSLPASTRSPRANRIDEWPVPNQLDTRTGLNSVTCGTERRPCCLINRGVVVNFKVVD